MRAHVVHGKKPHACGKGKAARFVSSPFSSRLPLPLGPSKGALKRIALRARCVHAKASRVPRISGNAEAPSAAAASFSPPSETETTRKARASRIPTTRAPSTAILRCAARSTVVHATLNFPRAVSSRELEGPSGTTGPSDAAGTSDSSSPSGSSFLSGPSQLADNSLSVDTDPESAASTPSRGDIFDGRPFRCSDYGLSEFSKTDSQVSVPSHPAATTDADGLPHCTALSEIGAPECAASVTYSNDTCLVRESPDRRSVPGFGLALDDLAAEYDTPCWGGSGEVVLVNLGSILCGEEELEGATDDTGLDSLAICIWVDDVCAHGELPDTIVVDGRVLELGTGPVEVAWFAEATCQSEDGMDSEVAVEPEAEEPCQEERRQQENWPVRREIRRLWQGKEATVSIELADHELEVVVLKRLPTGWDADLFQTFQEMGGRTLEEDGTILWKVINEWELEDYLMKEGEKTFLTAYRLKALRR